MIAERAGARPPARPPALPRTLALHEHHELSCEKSTEGFQVQTRTPPPHTGDHAHRRRGNFSKKVKKVLFWVGV